MTILTKEYLDNSVIQFQSTEKFETYDVVIGSERWDEICAEIARLKEAQKPVAVSDRLPTKEDWPCMFWHSDNEDWEILESSEDLDDDYYTHVAFTHWRRIDVTPPEEG